MFYSTYKRPQPKTVLPAGDSGPRTVQGAQNARDSESCDH